MVIGNLLGLWALIAVPALLLIHMLQQKARRMEVSTLFLLERVAPDASEGRRLDWLRSSVPLWLQLAAIAALVWVLVEPRFIEERSVQRAVLVLDSSASMSVFREPMIAEVDRLSKEIEKSAARTEWIVIDSDVAKKALYSGTDRRAAIAAVRAFSAEGGTHDFGPSLAVAQSLVRGRGPVVLVTDHHVDAGGVEVLAVGHPIENVGFTGLVVSRAEWTAMIRNHGRSPATRTLTLDGKEPREVALAPGEVKTFRGRFPDGEERARLSIGADEFPLDDAIPMVRPRSKLLRVRVDPEVGSFEVVQRLIAGLESAALVSTGADLVIAREGAKVDGNAILFRIDDREAATNELAPILAERSPLTEGLAWQGLLHRKAAPFEPAAGDVPVLWQGEHPLIALREGRRLIVAFDPRTSNADRLPSFAVLLLRFVESIRADKAELEARNVETLQPLSLAVSGDEQVILRTERDEQRFETREARTLTAPSTPGYFFVQQGKIMLLAGAARFGDLREGDLSSASSEAPSISTLRAIALRNSAPDPWRPLWILLAGAACAAAWAFRRKYE